MQTTSTDGPVHKVAAGRPQSRRDGPFKIVSDSRFVLGPDVRRLPIIISISFVMGLVEAGLVLLVVQMAVALAAGRQSFDVDFGPVATREVAVSTGAAGGVVLVLLLVGCLIPVARLIGRLSGRAQLRTRQRLLHAYLLASWEVRSRHPEGHLQELLTTFAQAAERSVAQLLGAAVALCGLTAILSVAFIASPAVAVVAILCVALVGLLLRPMMGLTRSASSAYVTGNTVFAGRTAEVARLTPEIAAFDVAEPVEAAMVARSADVAASLQRLRTLARINNGLYQYVALILVVLAIGGASQFADPEALATMGTVLLLLVRALAYGQQLQSQVQGASENAPFLVMIEQQLAVLGEARVDRGGVAISEPTPVWLHDVRFAYEPGRDVLRGVTFGIMPGELLGIVGPSGAGKSTLVQILLRLQRPTDGAVLVGDVPLGQVSLSRWYELVAYVPQDNKLIHGTVTDNIRFFRADVGDDAVRQAAQRAHLHEEITLMPEGYDTVVGPGARDLSGGQRQRLGIARALVGPARLVILDEPTSALDARSEQLVAETLSELRGSMTIVIVAHRPATTAICDRIIRIVDGRASVVPSVSGGAVSGR